MIQTKKYLLVQATLPVKIILLPSEIFIPYPKSVISNETS